MLGMETGVVEITSVKGAAKRWTELIIARVDEFRIVLYLSGRPSERPSTEQVHVKMEY